MVIALFTFGAEGKRTLIVSSYPKPENENPGSDAPELKVIVCALLFAMKPNISSNSKEILFRFFTIEERKG
ncbi:MAG: hypothetical protein ACI87M_000600 [Yoonia sp.]|jgi:hypothetical protein